MEEQKRFDHRAVDAKWQKYWRETDRYKTDVDDSTDKMYVLDMFPYPSGAGLHVGHPLGYIGTDIVARYYRALGKNVLHTMGWDAFGLPAENYAIKTGTPPAQTTQQAIERYRQQLQLIGLSYDWSREVNTSDSGYYRWTQWLFIQLYKKGLAYRADAVVNWCPKDQTVLANEQVVQGRCERCESIVEQRQLAQWFFKTTAYADELISGLDTVDWPESIKAMQRNWIGKSEGTEVDFSIAGNDSLQVTVFTTRIDTLFGATYLVLAPEHPLVASITSSEQKEVVEGYVALTKTKQELERKSIDKPKTGVFTGSYAINPANQEEIPVWIADYVLMGYGTGAIMAVPAHDERDYAFAKANSLPINQVILPCEDDTTNPSKEGLREVNRETVIVHLRNKATGQFALLNWHGTLEGTTTAIMGGIETDQSPEQAARAEIKEEAGLDRVSIIRTMPWVTAARYCASHKNENRKAITRVLLAEVEDIDTQQVVDDNEKALHTLIWVDEQEVINKLTPDHQKMVWQQLWTESPLTGEGELINSGEYTGISSSLAREKMVTTLGRQKIHYRLRDWLVSRQRYWGAPIPIIHCADCGLQPVPEDQLPVLLPTDVDFKPTGESPIAGSVSFQSNVTCPTCKKPAQRETDTMDTFVDSSWYFLRYLDPSNTESAFQTKKANEWLPVDWYVGGAEHAVLHLMYARFVTKFLADEHLIDFREPFNRLRNQGLIRAEDNRKMSKRWGNVINPDDVVREYGADALRCFEMFMGPFGDSKPWSTQGLIGVRRWLERVWRLQDKISNTVDRSKALSKAIRTVTPMILNFEFNTIVSQLMILTNDWEKQSAIHPDDWADFLRLLAPLAPHITNELWENAHFGSTPETSGWPARTDADIKDDKITLPVQINGKTRTEIVVAADLNPEALKTYVQTLPEVQKYLTGKTIEKIIIIPGRIISFVIS